MDSKIHHDFACIDLLAERLLRVAMRNARAAVCLSTILSALTRLPAPPRAVSLDMNQLDWLHREQLANFPTRIRLDHYCRGSWQSFQDAKSTHI